MYNFYFTSLFFHVIIGAIGDESMEKRAVVLSGGGAKGAYQVGVWKALRKLHYSYQIVTGTSVGALNGMLMVQHDYRKCIKLWEKMNFEKLFNENFPENVYDFKTKKKVYEKYASNFFKNGGMDVQKFEKLVFNIYKPFSFFHSNIDFGTVAYNLTTGKSLEITKEQMTEQTAPHYIIASASCYPAFPIKQVKGEKLIDGGYFDNLPINLAISLGATSIVAVDLHAVGRKQKVKNTKIPITYISPHNQIVSFLVFQEDLSKKAIKYGYNDTMKAFGKLEGNMYTFKKYERKREYFKRYSKLKEELEHSLLNQDKKDSLVQKLLCITTFYYIFTSNNQEKQQQLFYEMLELIGKTLKIDDTKIYRIDEFNKICLQELSKIEVLDFSLIEQKIKEKKVKSLFKTSIVLKFLYYKFQTIPNKKQKKDNATIALLFPQESVAAMYLNILNKKYHIIK